MARAVGREERYSAVGLAPASDKRPAAKAGGVASMGNFLRLETLGDGETGASGLVPLRNLSLVVDQIGE